jgi:hypothetical protein
MDSIISEEPLALIFWVDTITSGIIIPELNIRFRYFRATDALRFLDSATMK